MAEGEVTRLGRLAENRYIKKHPWIKTLVSIRARTSNPRSISYKNYGGRGIKCLIDRHELKRLWIRDGAHFLKRPSIDRINSNGNYQYKNCRYIELSENIGRRKYKRLVYCRKGHKFTRSNTLNALDNNGRNHRSCRICVREYQKKYYRLKNQIKTHD
jgi:hypothetical protein